MFKKNIVLPLVVVLGIAITGCTPDAEPPKVEDQKPPIVDQSPNTDKDVSYDNSLSSYENIVLTPTEAFNKYMEKYPNTKVKKVELDYDFGAYIYKIEGYDNEKEYDLTIDPLNGDILKEDIEMDKDNNGELTKAQIEKVEALVNEALKDFGEGGNIKEWTLDLDNGKSILEIEIDKEDIGNIEYKYDVDSGKLIEKDE